LVRPQRRGRQHKGTAFVEILQNCNIFNDGAFAHLTERDVRADNQLVLEHGKALVFGKDRNKGIRIRGHALEVVELGDGIDECDLIVHDENDPVLAFLLAQMAPPQYPTPLGVLRTVSRPTYDEVLAQQLETARQQQGDGDLAKLLSSGDTWVVP